MEDQKLTATGEKINVEAMTWASVKSVHKCECNIFELGALLLADDGPNIFKKIILDHTSLREEDLERMKFVDICSLYTEIVRITLQGARDAIFHATDIINAVKEVGVEGMSLVEVKTFQERGFDICDVNPLMMTSAQVSMLEKIIVEYTSLREEELEIMKFADICGLYTEIFLLTLRPFKVAIQSNIGRSLIPKLIVIKGGENV